MGRPFSVRIAVRSYELDALGHVNQAVYHQYAEYARVELFRAAGCGIDPMVEGGAAPVLLESRISYRRELRSGDEVDVTAEVRFGTGKTFTIDSVLTKADGTVSAEVTCVLGLMDLTRRRLLADPAGHFARMATDPTALGVPG